jgi:hypothetical protein
MALKKCKECGQEISTKADKCPHCGVPNKRKPIGCGGFLLILFIIGIFGSIFGGSDSSTSKAPASTTPPPPVENVLNSSWDASVWQVESYLQKTLKDPDSFEAIEWSPVQKVNLTTHKYIVRCKYRAKNSFGGYAVANQIFYLDKSGNVVNIMDVN